MASNISFSNILAFLFLFFSLFKTLELDYPAVFNFGDSNSDTGGIVAGMAQQLDLPYGQTYFHKPSGRFCDGRLIIDFLMDAMDLPFLNPYLESIGAPSFRKGCNFATTGSTILPTTVTYSPFPFGIQVSQFLRFKVRVLELLSQGNNLNKYLPKESYFREGLYMFDIGQNDLISAFQSTSEDQALVSIPSFLSEFESGIKRLYSQGARKFWIHNTGPQGCLPKDIAQFGKDPSKLDEFGCVKAHNHAANAFNLQLLTLCRKFQDQFSDATVTCVDIFSIKIDLISNYSKYGFEEPGIVEIENRTLVTTNASEGRSKYVSWDGIHYTEAANQHVSSQILTGKYSKSTIF